MTLSRPCRARTSPAAGEALGRPGGCGRSYADLVARVEACLLDAFGTILTCDFTAHTRELPALAGIPADAMYQEFARIAPALTDGRLSMAAGYGRILRACGAEPRPELVRALADRGMELLLASGGCSATCCRSWPGRAPARSRSRSSATATSRAVACWTGSG